MQAQTETERRRDEWPRTQAKLQLLESYSREIQRSIAKMQMVLEMLTERPDFETLAEDEMAKALKAVSVTHAFLKSALETYSKLPPTA